ncbi:methyltransferase domain-containing protein [Rhodopseudomonas palustris]|uniref:class I SAM-dependent methyltransferase n=1 Tax=Rhodopseudomonas palustris TaxID=1076 RepID=UPI0021F26EFB|nr:methyltransferase domain-containing protein [Rhodopseudomonas palustris]UYO44997.1 methyltransferase domain-containing protein [Rhodopseudomonas palustris]
MSGFLVLLLVPALWVGWRMASRRTVLPCPSEIAWLVEMENPLARATRSEQVVAQLQLRPGDHAIDIGCGPGRVTLPLARAVGPSGQVTALDIQDGMLAKVAAKAEAEGLTNIRPLRADVREAGVAADSLDAAVMVMALGEFPRGTEIFPSVHRMLRPGGRLLVAESVFDPHYVSRRRVRERVLAAGFRELRCTGNAFGYSITFERP